MIETRFKKTEVGEIPEDWEVKAFTDICSLKHGFQFRDYHFSDTGIKIVKIGNLSYDGKLNFTKVSYIADKNFLYYSCFKLLKGDILMALTGATLGKCSIVLTDELLLQNYRVGNFINKRECLKQYIYYLLNSKYIQNSFNNFVNQAAQPNIGKRDFDKMIVPVPPFPEQQRIATALSNIDTLLSAINKKIEKKKLIKQGAMQQLLTGKKRLAGFTEPWEEKMLGEILTIGNGRDYKHLRPGFIPVFGTGGVLSYVNDWLYDGETVCIGRKGTIDEPIYYNGKIWTVDTLFYTHLFIDSYPKFIYYLFQTIDWLMYNEATGVPSLSKINIYQIQVSIPTLSEQSAIATILSNMDKEIEALEAKRTKYTQVKQGMMQQLLTGRIRLVD